MKLTVIIRDNAPLMVLNDPPTHRSVQIQLTKEQIDAIELKVTGVDCGKDIREQISQCFIEEL